MSTGSAQGADSPGQGVHTPAETWLSVGEAAEAAGLSLSAVRNYAQGGHVRTRQGTGPRGQRQEVLLEDVQRRAEETGAARAVAGREDPGVALVLADTAARLENAHGMLRDAGDRAARAEVRVEMQSQLLEELRVALAAVTAERDQLREELRTPAPPPAVTPQPQDRPARRWFRGGGA